MSDLALFGIYLIGASLVMLGVPAWMEIVERRQHAKQAHERAKQARLAKGYPPHPNCICAECRHWRAYEANVQRMAQ